MAKVSLVVIEAPGKVERLSGLFAELGVPARIVATRGHVAGFPDDPTRIGVTIEGETPGRDWKPGAKARLLTEFSAPDVARVVVATDDDDEGDAIAWDVAGLAGGFALPVQRLRLGGLAREPLRAGLGALEDVQAGDAAAGRVRGMIDRVLGIGLSSPTHGAGRVLTPLLALGEAGEYRRVPVDLVLPVQTGGMPFQARGWLVPEEVARLRAALLASGLPVLAEEPTHVAPPLSGTGELLVRLAAERGQGPDLASRMLQALYENGRMSYCRAYGAPLPRSAVATLARSAGLAAIPSHVAIFDDGSGHGAHPAPHPLVPVPLATDLTRLADDEAALVIVGRAQAEATLQDWRGASVPAWEDWLQRVGLESQTWSRPMRPVGRLLGWLQRREPGCHAVRLPLSARIVQAMLRHGLGRPSTYAEHAERLVARELVVSDGALSDKGRRWLWAAPEALRRPELSKAIEAWCRTPGEGEAISEPWRDRFRRILASLPDEVRVPATAAMLDPTASASVVLPAGT